MGEDEIRFEKNNLVLAILITLGLILALYYFLLRPKETVSGSSPFISDTTTPTKFMSPQTIEVTSSSTSTSLPLPEVITNLTTTSTPVHYPTPIRGELRINLPENFEVIQWRDDYDKCDKNLENRTVKIYGLIISGGIPPYKFRFWRFDLVLSPVQATPIPNLILPPQNLGDPSYELIMFDRVVELKKDVYINITITFEWENGTGTWIDDLYYPYQNDFDCQEP